MSQSQPHTQPQSTPQHQQPISPSSPLKGSCFCGSITYTLNTPPTHTYICHCLDCRRFTGSSFAYNGMFPAEALKVTAKDGERIDDVLTTFGGGVNEKGGRGGTRQFCKRCGSGLFMTVGEKEGEMKEGEMKEGEMKEGEEKVVIIAMGTVDGSEKDERLKPIAEGWCKRRESWMRKASGTGESDEW